MSFIETKLQVVETFDTGETVKKSGFRTVYEKNSWVLVPKHVKKCSTKKEISEDVLFLQKKLLRRLNMKNVVKLD